MRGCFDGVRELDGPAVTARGVRMMSLKPYWVSVWRYKEDYSDMAGKLKTGDVVCLAAVLGVALSDAHRCCVRRQRSEGR